MITNYTAKTLGYSLVSSISEKLSDASDFLSLCVRVTATNGVKPYFSAQVACESYLIVDHF
jgi:hypothetical protein